MDMSINQRLKSFLADRNLSQEELRIKLGLKARQQISNWLSCRDHIPEKHLIGIMRAFPDLNANWLLRNVGSPQIEQKLLRQINRNEFGFCEDCIEKDKKIEVLEEITKEKDAKLENAWMQIGKLHEQLASAIQMEKNLKKEK